MATQIDRVIDAGSTPAMQSFVKEWQRLRTLMADVDHS